MSHILVVSTILMVGVMTAWFQDRSSKRLARQVFMSNAEVAAKAVEANKANTIALETIHNLVNSTLTAAQQGELNAHRAALTTLREFANFKESQGFTLSQETIAGIRLAEERVHTLERDIKGLV